MIRLLLRAAPARIRAAPALALLQIAAISLGVGAVLSVQLLNRAALDALDANLEVLSGNADLVVSGWIEEPGSVPDAAWPTVAGTPGVENAAPVVRLPDGVVAAGELAAPIAIRGVDALSGSFRFADRGSARFSADEFFRGGIALSREAAERLGVEVGDPVRIGRRGRTRETAVAGIFGGEGAGTAAFLDIAFAQALRGSAGLDRIEVSVAEGFDPAAVSRELRRRVPGVRIETPGVLREEGAEVFSAFRLHLTALSAVSLLVGAFLVYASVRAALAARRREIGLYRALGAPAGRVGALLFGEVLLSAFVGAILGIPVGALAALASLDRVSATITNFYLLESVESVTVTPGAVAVSLGVGGIAAFFGALPEVVAEVRRPPAALLAPGRELPHRSAGRLRRFVPTLAGGALVAVAAWPVVISGGAADGIAGFAGGFGAAAALLLGSALLPGGVLAVLSPLAAGGGRSAFWRGVAAAVREPRSTGPTAAGLVVAVTMLTGVTALIGSFRNTLDGWLRETLVADIYVSRGSGPGRVAAERRALPPEVLDAASRAPEVASRDLLRAVRIRLGGRPVPVLGVEPALPQAGKRFSILGDREGALAGFRAGDILISEPLARRLDLEPGDRLALPTGGPGGKSAHAARIAGVYRDYGNESGALFLDRELLNRLYPPPDPAAPELHGMALYLRAGADRAAVLARLERELQGAARLTDNTTLRARALRIFDQTMAVTGLLRVFALLIAALGMALALWTFVRERVPEIALQRALGASRSQVVAGFAGRAVLIAGLALLIGGGAGALLTLLLVRVINPLWFGWSLDLHWPAANLAALAGAVLLAGLLAAAIPARLASRVSATELREEL